MLFPLPTHETCNFLVRAWCLFWISPRSWWRVPGWRWRGGVCWATAGASALEEPRSCGSGSRRCSLPVACSNVRQGTARQASSGWLLKSRVPVLGTEVNGNRCGARAGAGGTRNPPARAGVGLHPWLLPVPFRSMGLTHAVWGARDYVPKRVPLRKLVC